MKERAWILVANAEMAKVYRVVKIGTLQEVSAITHPERALKAKDIVSDKPGRTFERGGITRHAYVPQTTEKEKKDELFAREIADFLNAAWDRNHFAHLYLIAEPHFLGVLKKHLPPHLLKVVDKAFAKDMVNQQPSLIWEHCEITS